jgi:peptidyl-prolyl cis-trans isomerase B (cyclophilin B)
MTPLEGGLGMATPNPRVQITTSAGTITIELYAAEAPITVENFLAYVQGGYYAGTIFHRVIPSFMIQGGGLDPSLRDKREGHRAPIKNEAGNGLRNDVGTLAMARTSDPHSATSQFFINVRNNDFLNKERSQDGVGYAVFGRVVEGMDVVRRIEQVRTTAKGGHKDVPAETITIVSAEVLAQ